MDSLKEAIKHYLTDDDRTEEMKNKDIQVIEYILSDAVAINNISIYKKNLIKGTIIDAINSEYVNYNNDTREIFADLVSSTLDSDFEDDITEEICALLLVGFNGYSYYKDTKVDYELLHQVRLGVENGVDITPHIDAETDPKAAFALRLHLQSISYNENEDDEEISQDTESEHESEENETSEESSEE